jgi:peroxiredoxin
MEELMKRKNVSALVLPLLLMSLIVTACGGALPGGVTTQQETSVEVRSEPEKPAEEAMTGQEAMAGETMATKEETVDDEMMAADEAMMDPEEAAEEAMAEKEEMSDEAMMEEQTVADETMAEQEEPAEEAMMDKEEPAEQAMTGPAWFKAELTDVNTGETFTVADFQSKVVLVETMAVWCPLCTQQQGQIRALRELLGDREDLVSLSLDIDPNESADILKTHTERNGFGWHFAVAPTEVAREIGQLYGGQFLNPPATPIFIIDRQGEVHPLPFGHKEASVLQENLEPFLNEG